LPASIAAASSKESWSRKQRAGPRLRTPRAGNLSIMALAEMSFSSER